MPDKTKILAISTSQQRSPLLMLLNDKFHIDYAADSDEVIEKTSDNEPFDLLLIDINSLEGKARELCLWLKTDDETKDLPIVVIGEEAETSEWLQIGALDFLYHDTNSDLAFTRLKNHLELKYKSDLLASIAKLDGLTSLPNGVRLDEYLDIEWRRSLREYYPISLIKVDIDDFAGFNDRYGLGVGDDVLRRIARCLQDVSSRAGDMVSRYSNDEFMILLPVTELDNALVVAERMVSSIAELSIDNEVSEVAKTITVSAGVVTIEPSLDKRYEDLFDEADEMLYNAQQQGGNCAQGISI